MIKNASALQEGDLLKLHSHPTRMLDGEEREHGPSIKLHPAASEHSTHPSYTHGLLYWTVLRTWTRDWVHVTSGGAGLDAVTGWAHLLSNSFELIQP